MILFFKTQFIKILVISLFLSSLDSFSQTFDESFLDSLPAEVRSDLLEQRSNENLMQETQYRRPSTFIEKPPEDSNRFGMSIFSMMQSTLMPLNEPNFDSDYVLDFGDKLEIQLIGSKSLTVQPVIKRDGSINMPDLGKIFLSGMSLDAATQLLQEKVKASFVGVEAFVSLINVRDIQVIVAGNVYNPGPYTLNGNSNVFHALSVSGGPSELGSFREIDLIRDDKVIETIDLYKTFIYGKSSFGKRLRAGDIIFVKPSNKVINISGGVKRPASYELKENENFDELIFFANGFTKDVNRNDTRLERIENGSVEIKKFEDLSKINLLKVKDGDNLIIGKFPFRKVTIQGSIKNPGTYMLEEGDGILALVNKAGGYTDTAYPFGGVLRNEFAKEINIESNKILSKYFLNLLSQNPSSIESDAIQYILNSLDAVEVSGRLVAEFDIDKLSNGSNDIVLQENDFLIIPEFPNHVFVFGEVSNPGSVIFEDDQDYRYFISETGGFTDFSDKKSIFILSPNGISHQIKKNIFMNNRKNIEIFPGSIIFVPKQTPTGFFSSETAQAYSSILGNIGVSLASISVLKD